MKRILFLVGITATLFVGCGKKEEPKPKPPVQTPLQTDCPFFDELGTLSPGERLEWLKGKGKDICENDNHLNCVAMSHQLDSVQIATVESQMATAKIVTFTLSEILNGQECGYEKYVAFHVDPTDGNITIDTSSDFNTTTGYSCYSRPLFHGLQKKHNLTNTSEFKFFVVDFGGTIGETIVFKIDNITNAYFDYSKWPSMVEGEKNPM